jgi:hypothetical protein
MLESTTSVLQHPSLPQVDMLCSTFLTNVDRVFKVLHGPSLKRYLYGQVRDLDGSPGPRGLEALRFAIYYAATTTLTAEQCMRQIGEERSALLIKYRSSIELALVRADFVNTVELSTLQALVIFLVSLPMQDIPYTFSPHPCHCLPKVVTNMSKVSVRSNDTTRFGWTVLSLAIRIANALGLHREESFASLRPFDKEMRRRLWWQIFILDGQGAHDRGSDPIITMSSFNTRKPSHVNDEDLTPEGVEEPKERESFTDMTFSSVCHDVAEAVILLNFVPAGEPELAQNDVVSAWDRKRDLVIGTQCRVQDKYLRYCDLAIPFHYTTNRVADIIMATFWLSLYRPLQKRVGYSTSFQPRNPNILHLSVEVMEKSYQLNIDPAAETVRWLSSNYTQWHPLAVTLAELCVQTEGPMVERAWTVVDALFAGIEQTVADSNTGMLWSPIRKLARRARSARQHRLQMVAARPITGHFDVKGASPTSTQVPTSSMMDLGPTAMDGQPATVPQQYLPSSSAPTFDWDTWLQPNAPEFELDLADTNYVAWANWEGFVEDLYGPGDLMQE